MVYDGYMKRPEKKRGVEKKRKGDLKHIESECGYSFRPSQQAYILNGCMLPDDLAQDATNV